MDLQQGIGSPSYHYLEHSLRPQTEYLVSFNVAKVVALCWLFVLANYLHDFFSEEFNFREDVLKVDAEVNEGVINFLTEHQTHLQVSSVISFIISILYFFSMSVWVLLLEDFGSHAIFAASFVQLLGPISAILQLASMMIITILCTTLPSPSEVVTIAFFIQAFCFQISFSFFGVIACSLGISLVNIRRSKRNISLNTFYCFILSFQFILSLMFNTVFYKNGLIKFPFNLGSIIWYSSITFTSIVAFAEVCWLLLYDPDIFQKQKFDDLTSV